MGVLPLQYPAGQNAASLGLTGTETFAVEGVTALNEGTTPKTLKVTATAEDGTTTSFDAVLRIDTRVKPTTTATAASCSTCCARSPRRVPR